MYSNERFVVGHLRMLLISRFTYEKVEEVIQVQSAKVVILVRPELYDLASAMLFFMSGRWPVSKKYTRRVRGLRDGYSIVAVVSHMNHKRFSDVGFEFFWKCQAVYFPLLDSTDPSVASLFKLHASPQNWQTMYNMSNIVEAVPELDAITEGSFGAIKALASSVIIRLIITTNGVKRLSDKNEHLNALRTFCIPAILEPISLVE